MAKAKAKRKTKTALRVAWLKTWGKRVRIQHDYQCPTNRGFDSECCCGATRANKELKELL